MSARQDFEDRFAATLEGVRAAGLLRRMRLAQGIDLVSNDYLGLADHPALAHAMVRALAVVPAGSGGSRLFAGIMPCSSRSRRGSPVLRDRERRCSVPDMRRTSAPAGHRRPR